VATYVDLPGQANIAEDHRPNPQRDAGWAEEFALLVDVRFQKSVGLETNKTQKVPLTNIGEASRKYPRFVLAGKPGTGKTTTLRRLALDVAHRRLANPHSAPFPLLLYLSSWKDETAPSDLIRAHWPFSSDPLPLLVSGDIVLYMDGLNEMGPMGKARAEELRHWLMGSAAPAKVIISCRLDDYTEDLDLKLPTVLVDEMDPARIERFASNYLGEMRVSHFLSSVFPQQPVTRNTNRSLVELARNPYLLAALIYIYLNAPAGALPRNAGQLFHALVKALWTREQQKRTPGWVPFEDMQMALSHLAFAMIDGDMASSVPQQVALDHIEDVALLGAARSANLMAIRDDQVSFYHQLMQDYFAAVYMINEQIDPGKFLEVDQYESTMKYWQVMGGKWKYVVIAWSGLVDDADSLLRGMTGLSAALFIGEGYVASDTMSDTIVKSVGADFGAYHHFDYEPAINAYRALGSAATPFLLEKLHSGDPVTRHRAVWILGKNRDPSAVPALASLLSDTSEGDYGGGRYGGGRICDAAAAALTEIGTQEAQRALLENRNVGPPGSTRH